jgi:hypothetical protein
LGLRGWANVLPRLQLCLYIPDSVHDVIVHDRRAKYWWTGWTCLSRVFLWYHRGSCTSWRSPEKKRKSNHEICDVNLTVSSFTF